MGLNSRRSRLRRSRSAFFSENKELLRVTKGGEGKFAFFNKFVLEVSRVNAALIVLFVDNSYRQDLS